MALTPRYNLTALPPTPSAEELDKFASADRYQMDAMLWAAATHRHDGATIAAATAPSDALVSLAEVFAGGYLPSEADIHYRWSVVSAAGIESPASPPVTITTGGKIATPAAPPSVAVNYTGGSCYPGPWMYRVTAWRGTFNADTIGSPAVVANLFLANGEEQTIILELPELPDLADGFNIYRQVPGSTNMQYLTSILDGAWDLISGTPVFIDTGGPSELPERSLSSVDGSGLPSRVDLSVASVPTGEKIRLYRSYVAGKWANTFIGELEPGVLSHPDLGGGSDPGTPLETSSSYSNPGQVDLGTETDGILAYGRIQAAPAAIGFSAPGATALGVAGGEQALPYLNARVVSVTAALAAGAVPDVDDLVFDVEVLDGTWQVLVPDVTIPVGNDIVHVDIDEADVVELARGARLRCNVTQIGGGGNTDTDLRVDLVATVRHEAPAFDWEP